MGEPIITNLDLFPKYLIVLKNAHMKILLFVSYDDPSVINFYQANIFLSDSPIVFIEKDLVEKMESEGVTYIIMSQREECSLEEYVALALRAAKFACEENEVEHVVCLVPYEEFVEIIYTEKSLTAPYADFFYEHHFYEYETGENGFLYELRADENDLTRLYRLSDDELKLLPCVN